MMKNNNIINFQKETNMNEIKKVTLMLLHMEIRDTEYSPMIVDHPVYSSMYASDGKEMLILSDQEQRKRMDKQYEKMINIAHDVRYCMHIIRAPYYPAFLKLCRPYLSLSDFSSLLSEVWVSMEFPNRNPDMPVELAKEWFAEAEKSALMNADELEVLNRLPDLIHVYRGITDIVHDDGLSWTTDRNIANWFAARWIRNEDINEDGEPEERYFILHGIAKKKDILAYFSRRGESEIVISPDKLLDFEVLTKSY